MGGGGPEDGGVMESDRLSINLHCRGLRLRAVGGEEYGGTGRLGLELHTDGIREPASSAGRVNVSRTPEAGEGREADPETNAGQRASDRPPTIRPGKQAERCRRSSREPLLHTSHNVTASRKPCSGSRVGMNS